MPVLVPGWQSKRFSTREEATQAAIELLPKVAYPVRMERTKDGFTVTKMNGFCITVEDTVVRVLGLTLPDWEWED